MQSLIASVVADANLVPDILSTCELAGITSDNVCTFSAKDLAEQLFLTEAEAQNLLELAIAPNAAEKPIEMMEPTTVEEVVVHVEAPAVVIASRADPVRASSPAFIDLAEDEEEESTADKAVPSYLKPTAAYVARSKATPETIPESPVKPYVPPPKTKASAKKYANVVSKIFLPTTNYLARIIGKGPGARQPPPPKTDVLRQSMVAKVLSSPQGQRVTKVEPFSVHATAGKEPLNQVPTEEASFKEAQAKAFKPLPMPKKTYQEARPLTGFYKPSSPKAPEEIYQPFNLASVERSAAVKAKLSAQLEERKKAEEELRKFKARSLDMSLIEKPHTPRKPEAQPVTKGVAPCLKAEQRAQLYREEINASRLARLSPSEREKLAQHERELEAERAFLAEPVRKAKEEREYSKALSKMSVEELRKSMVFTACKMPNLNNPFTPDPKAAQKPTKPVEFAFKTDERLGKPGQRPVEVETPLNFSSTLRNKFANAGVSQSVDFSASTSKLPASTHGGVTVRRSHQLKGAVSGAHSAMRASTSTLPARMTSAATSASSANAMLSPRSMVLA